MFVNDYLSFIVCAIGGIAPALPLQDVLFSLMTIAQCCIGVSGEHHDWWLLIYCTGDEIISFVYEFMDYVLFIVTMISIVENMAKLRNF